MVIIKILLYVFIIIMWKVGFNMKSNNRIIRINDEIKREISEIIRSELKDPRVGTITSVISVNTTTDLKHCKVAVSVLGDDVVKKEVMEGLKNASGFIRKMLAARINLRNTPELKFILDDSMEYSIKISKIINEINK